MEIVEEVKTVKVDDLNLAYKTWGSEDAPLILALHGWLDNADTFQKIVPGISQTHYVFAIDFAGHGLSDHRTQNASYHLWDYALDVLKLIESKKWKKITLLGHSMGTGVAAILAATKPNLFEKLIFIDGLGAPFVLKEGSEVAHFQKSYRLLEMEKKLRSDAFSEKNEPVFYSKEEAITERMNSVISSLSYPAAETLVPRSLKKVPGGYRWKYDTRLVIPECYRMTEKQARLFLSSIECEVLLILGIEGLFAHISKQERIKCLKNARVEWLEGGHHLHLENASTKIQELINQFIHKN